MSSKMQKHSYYTILIVLFSVFASLEAELHVGFYRDSCPMAEHIVREEVVKGFFTVDKGFAPGLVRMHFHDCFVRGCDASILIDSTPGITTEKDSVVNNPSLRGFQVIDNAKARLERECKGIVSCADILAFAARDSIAITRGPIYDVPAGRRDGRVSLASEALRDIPGPTMNVAQLTQSFKNKGLEQDEMVTLSGAHTIGRSHCTTLTQVDDRIYNFNNTNGPDPTLAPDLVADLRQACPRGSNDTTSTVPMDPSSPFETDEDYYENVLNNRGLFTSDWTLLTNPSTANEVKQNARNRFLWFNKFAAAMVRMGNITELTGTMGEIRTNCRVIN